MKNKSQNQSLNEMVEEVKHEFYLKMGTMIDSALGEGFWIIENDDHKIDGERVWNFIDQTIRRIVETAFRETELEKKTIDNVYSKDLDGAAGFNVALANIKKKQEGWLNGK